MLLQFCFFLSFVSIFSISCEIGDCDFGFFVSTAADQFNEITKKYGDKQKVLHDFSSVRISIRIFLVEIVFVNAKYK